MDNLQLTETIERVTAVGAVRLAEMFKNNFSITKMAKEILGDENHKGKMHRLLQSAIREYPSLFAPSSQI